jgi:glutathione S-transferase
MPYVQYLFGAKAGDLITSRPGVAGWWERISTRPSWKKVAG